MSEIESAVSIPRSTGYRFMVVGRTGAGKSAQIWTLPGRKFGYIFDPNSLPTIKGMPDFDFIRFMPEFVEMDATLKGFNKNARDDKPATEKEPTNYMRWVEDINERAEKGFFHSGDYQWLVVDSLTLLVKSIMARQLFINNRYGSIEDLGDFRIVGSKLSEVFTSISSLPINLYCTGHISTYQDDKTQAIETQLRLPGQARDILPMLFTEILLAQTGDGKGPTETYQVRTRPDTRGLKDIRTTLQGVNAVEDVTIKDWNKATSYGIGALLARQT